MVGWEIQVRLVSAEVPENGIRNHCTISQCTVLQTSNSLLFSSFALEIPILYQHRKSDETAALKSLISQQQHKGTYNASSPFTSQNSEHLGERTTSCQRSPTCGSDRNPVKTPLRSTSAPIPESEGATTSPYKVKALSKSFPFLNYPAWVRNAFALVVQGKGGEGGSRYLCMLQFLHIG